MPVKTKRDEHKWEKAQEIAEEAGQKDNWAYVMGIYKKMKPEYEFKSGPEAKKAAITKSLGDLPGIGARVTRINPDPWDVEAVERSLDAVDIHFDDGTWVPVHISSFQKRAGQTIWTVYLFSQTGKTLFKKDFHARDQRDAENKGHKIVLPHIDKHDDAEDWIVEEKPASRVATRYMKTAMPNSLQEIARNTFKGIPPDGDVWNGRPPNVSISFISPSVTVKSQEAIKGGATRFEASFLFGGGRTEGGPYCDDYLLTRFVKAFPGKTGQEALAKAFMDVVKSNAAGFKADIKNWFSSQTWKPFCNIVGYREVEDWETPKLVKITVINFARKPLTHRSPRMNFHLPVEVTAIIDAVKKPDMKVGPFDDMPDRELDTWIKQWEHEAPENFWMDGELGLDRNRAYAYYRKRWRAMRPREQQQIMDSLRYTNSRYANRRVAARVAGQKLPGGLADGKKPSDSRVAARYIQKTARFPMVELDMNDPKVLQLWRMDGDLATYLERNRKRDLPLRSGNYEMGPMTTTPGKAIAAGESKAKKIVQRDPYGTSASVVGTVHWNTKEFSGKPDMYQAVIDVYTSRS